MKTTIIILFTLFLAGCSASRITTSWKADNAAAKKYNKILVLGLIRDADRSVQTNMENHFTDDLKSMGINAVSSMQIYGPKAFENMDEQAALSKLRNSGIDAVMTIVLLNKEKEKTYVPGRSYYTPYGYYYNRFWGYSTTLYRRIYEPGYYVTDVKYFWETNLYDMSNQELLYSVQTETFDPADSESMGHEYGQLILKDLMKYNLLLK
ncbi:MAG: hypothetical protein IPI66_04280 [Chitinophagaceae bacterium]|nr:hypothetical protein [Chitinophagaceae bacterium]MBL0055574.1 hypothetical protein [Chitinophagaceae bacterium]